MKAQKGYIEVIVTVLVAVALILFLLIQLKPPTPPSASPESPLVYVKDPTQYVEQVKQNPPSLKAQQEHQEVLRAVGLSDGQSGEVASTSKFRVEWVAGPDNYWVEILDPNIVEAKVEAEQWFLQRFSKEDICQGGIAVLFYVNWDVRKQLPEGTPFASVPSFCL